MCPAIKLLEAAFPQRFQLDDAATWRTMLGEKDAGWSRVARGIVSAKALDLDEKDTVDSVQQAKATWYNNEVVPELDGQRGECDAHEDAEQDGPAGCAGRRL